MKIIFITRESKDMPAVRVRCYGFARYLRQAGMETEIFSFADDLGAKSGKQESGMSVWDKIGYNLKAFKYLADQDAVLFLQRCNYHSFAPLLLSLLSGKKLIFDLDDWEAREDTEYYFNKIPKSKAEMMMRFIAGHSCFCIGASRFLREYLRTYNKKVLYIPTAVDPDIFKPGPNPEKGENKPLVLSWLGTMYRMDNLENIAFLLDCFASIQSEYRDIRLEIIGEGIYYEQVQALVQNSSNVLLKPWIAPEQVPQYLRQIDIGIMPLIQRTKFNQSKSPTRLFEYMAMAKPVVVSKIGETEYIIEHGINGLLAQTKSEFISALKLLIENKDTREILGVNARKTVEGKFSLKDAAAVLVEEIKKI